MIKKILIVLLCGVSIVVNIGCTNENDSKSILTSPIINVEGIVSADFNNYEELSRNLVECLNLMKKEMQNENIDTSLFNKYQKLIESNNKVVIPVINNEKLDLRKKEDNYIISVQSRDLYGKPWTFYSFEDDDTNSYIKITDVSDELKQYGITTIYDFITKMDPTPNDDLMYPPYVEIQKETVDMYEKSVDVLFAQMRNDPRIYTNFLYDNNFVVICCSKEKLESGFLNEFGLGNLELK